MPGRTPPDPVPPDPTPPASGEPAVRALARLPVWVVALAVGVVVAVALVAGARWSAFAVLAVAALLGWLTSLAWPRLGTGARVLRVVVLGALVGWSAARLLAG